MSCSIQCYDLYNASRSTSKLEESIKYEDIKARVGRINGAMLNYCPIMHLNVERSVAILVSILDL